MSDATTTDSHTHPRAARSRSAWRWLRRAVQLALLVGFVWLFRRTEYGKSDQLPGGESLLFRLDPLAAISASLAGRKLALLCWPALLTLLATLLLGRFFCGWVCPLGTMLDITRRVTRGPVHVFWRGCRLLRGNAGAPAKSEIRMTKPEDCHLPFGFRHSSFRARLRPVRYVILIAVLVAAAFGLPLVGFVDPFSLLVRALTFWADPAWFRNSSAFLKWSQAHQWHTDATRTFFKHHLLPFREMTYHLAATSLALLAAIFALELMAQRFWCRYLCPLGAGLGLLARLAPIKRLPVKVCKTCGHCAGNCRMDALDTAAGLRPESCTLCMDCVDACPRGVAKVAVKRTKLAPAPVDFSRRGVLVSAATGVVLPAVTRAAHIGKPNTVNPHLLRPPGAGNEKTFLGLCVRCGECLKVCQTNVLQPALLQAGVEGMFSPYLVPRRIFEQSYCEYDCTLCGQVCPTGAIPRLTAEQKHQHPIGKAWFDHNLCLPWAKDTPCIRCEEMCPLPDKAIKIRNTITVNTAAGEEVELQQPYVDRDLCVGCGICESNCTLEGTAAIRVRRLDAPDPGTEFKTEKSTAGKA